MLRGDYIREGKKGLYINFLDNVLYLKLGANDKTIDTENRFNY